MRMDLNFITPLIQPTIPDQSYVLAIDDDEDNLIIISYVLNAMGCRCVTTTSGEEGLLLAQTREPSLLLLDIILPGIDGFEIIRHLKRNPSTLHIPIIAVTGLAFREDKKRILEAGCDDYLSKPYLIRDLESLIGHYIYQQPSLSSPITSSKHKN